MSSELSNNSGESTSPDISSKEINILTESLEQPLKSTTTNSIQYCGVCSVPPEYCCYGSRWEECKEWIIENYQFSELSKLNKTKEELLDEWEQVFEKENKKRQKQSKDSSDEKVVKIIVQNRGKRKHVTEIHNLDMYTDDMKEACSNIRKKFACAATVTGSSMKGRKTERNNKKQEKRKQRELERQNRKNRKNGIPEVDVEETKTDNKKSDDTQALIEMQGNYSKELPEYLCKTFSIDEKLISIDK